MLSEALELASELAERQQTAECLELVALGAGEPATAAQLIGAADAERASAGTDRKPDERPYFEQTEREAARALGPGPFERERARGRGMRLEDAVALAAACTARFARGAA